MVTQDIKENRIAFGTRSKAEDVQEIYRICLDIAKKVRLRQLSGSYSASI
jgi:hypothetical protein